MNLAKNLLRGIAIAAAKIGVKKLAYAGGAAAGMGGTFAENAVDMAMTFAKDVWDSIRRSRKVESAVKPGASAVDGGLRSDASADGPRADADVERVLRGEIEQVAQASAAEIRAAAEQAIEAAAPNLAPDEREALLTHMTGLPERLRRTLRRQDDPAGHTLPANFALRSPLDLSALIYPRLPRFKAGETPVYRRRLVELLGFGTFGEVWKAIKPDFEYLDPVALKFCAAEIAEEALLHEARLIQRLTHEGIVRLLDVHERHDDVPVCLEYEFVPGVELDRWYAERAAAKNPPTAALIAGLMSSLCKIMAAAHGFKDRDGKSAPIVHRDLKPGNILIYQVAGRGLIQTKVTDFGIGAFAAARNIEQFERQTRPATIGFGSSYTAAVLHASTPLYASPQQRRGERADPRDDVHAIGVIWYQLLLGDFSRAVPTGRGWMRGLEKKGVPPAQIDLIAACFDSEPEERPRDAAALAEAIEKQLRSPEGIPASQGTGKESVSSAASKVMASPTPKIVVAAPDGLPKEHSLDLGGGVKLDLVLIPAGEFMMGSPSNERDRYADEGPQHSVKISTPFYLAKYQVTQKQWQTLMGSNPSHFKGDNRPVESVSWEDVQRFCAKLAQKADRTIRLPTEAEWEYACRAGTHTRFHFGDSDSDLSRYGWYVACSDSQTHPVGQLKPNAFGLFDMHGNVWEWCGDWLGKYENDTQVDPASPITGESRVLRGGSWSGNPGVCSSAYRGRGAPDSRSFNSGFRIVSGTT